MASTRVFAMLIVSLWTLTWLPSLAQDNSKAMSGAQAGDVSKSRSAIRADPFELAAKQISTIGRFDGDHLSLAVPGSKPDVVFDLYGEAIRCERDASFSIIALKNAMGAIGVAVCEKEATRVRDAARTAEQKLTQTVKDLQRSLQQPGNLKAMGWEWTSQRYDGGWEGFSFPVIGTGHGIGWANMVVL